MEGSKTLRVSHPEIKRGQRVRESRDYSVVRPMDETLIIGVADGVTNCSYGGSVAKWIMERHLGKDDRVGDALRSGSLMVYLDELYKTFNSEFADMPDMLDSACTVSIAGVHLNKASCYWGGDSPIFVLIKGENGYAARLVSLPDTDPATTKLTDCFGSYAPCRFKQATIDLDHESVIVVASDGGKLEPVGLAGTLNQKGFTQEWLDELSLYAQTGRFYDDITIVAYKHVKRHEI